MKNTMLKLLCILITVTAATISHAGSPEAGKHKKSGHGSHAHSKEAFLLKNDSNEDGVVSKKEFDAARKESYEDKDANGDGVVTADEYVAEWEGRLEKQLEAQRKSSIKQAYVRYGVLDSDENGGMTLEEFNTSGDKTFSRYDANDDGSISEDDTVKKKKAKGCSSDSSDCDSAKKSCCCSKG